jgi:biotin carboxyl carrier protein
MLAYGIDPKVIMAELTGRRRRHLQGQGGSMHMFSVGAWLLRRARHRRRAGEPGTGLAFKHKYSEDGGVNLAYFGDGAANQGQVYESFNMAKLWDLPVIYAIENNHYAMGTSVERSASEPISTSAARASASRASRSTAWTCWRCAARPRRRWNGRARQGADHPRAQDLPLPRPFDVRPGQVPDARGSADYRESRDPIEHAKRDLEAFGRRRRRAQAIDKEIKDIVVEAAKFAEERRSRSGRASHRRAGGELLMPTELTMPALSPTMEEGTLAKWLVKEGDEVTSGTIIAEIETDKATMEFEAIDEGIVAKILVAEGTDEVKVGTVIAILRRRRRASRRRRRRCPRRAAGR